jgi:hypothetical protein
MLGSYGHNGHCSDSVSMEESSFADSEDSELGRNAVELGCRMEQADRRRRVVGNVLLFSPLHQESRMLRAFHCAGAGALPTSRVRPLCDFLNCLPDCLRESQRGKKPPARKPGGG